MFLGLGLMVCLAICLAAAGPVLADDPAAKGTGISKPKTGTADPGSNSSCTSVKKSDAMRLMGARKKKKLPTAIVSEPPEVVSGGQGRNLTLSAEIRSCR